MTLAVYLRGKCAATDVVPYIIVQLIAAAAAAFAVAFLKGPEVMAGLSPLDKDLTENLAQVLLAEFLFTFALCFVILNVATAEGTSGNSFYGLAIGFTVMAGAFAVGPVSNAAFNPAVALGISIMKLAQFSQIWVYLIANFAGGAVAAVVFKFVNGPDAETS